MLKVTWFLLLVALVVQPLCANDCIATTADVYVGLGSTGCTVGMLLFSNFTYTPTASGNVTPAAPGGLPATDFLITPLIDANGTGFVFSPTVTWTASVGLTDVELTYVVQSISGQSIMNGTYIEEDGTVTGDSSVQAVTGSDHVLEDYCPGITTQPLPATCPGYSGATPQISARIFSGMTSDFDHNVFNAPVSQMSVLKDISLDSSGNNAGLNTITAIRDQVDFTPEPGTLVLLGGGLAAIFFRCRRRRPV